MEQAGWLAVNLDYAGVAGSEAVTVLLVDDDPLVRMTTAIVLEGAAYAVLEAEHGPHAVALIARHPGRFSMLVTDFHMPHGMTGVDLVEHMRPLYPRIPMVIATALPDVIDAGWAVRHAVRVLAKPYSAAALLSLLAALVAG